MRSRAFVLDAIAFGLLAIGLTWPLAVTLQESVPGVGADDNVVFLWNFWWMRMALASPLLDFFQTTYLFYPFGTSLALSTHTALPAFVGATVFGSLPLAAAQNVILIGATFLNGLCAYLLIRYLTTSRGGALVGAVFYMSCPFFAGHLLGHFNLMAGWALPLIALAVGKYDRRGALGWMIAAGALVGMLVYVDYYYVVYALICLAIWAVWPCAQCGPIRFGRATARWIDVLLILCLCGLAASLAVLALTGGGVFAVGPLSVSMTSGTNARRLMWLVVLVLVVRRWRPRVDSVVVTWPLLRRRLGHLGAALVCAACIAAPVIVLLVGVAYSGNYSAPRPMWRSTAEGIDLLSFLAGSPFHPIWGEHVTRLYYSIGANTIENTGWMGLGPVVILFLQRRAVWSHAVARKWAATALFFAVWALGPQLTIAGVETGLLLPEILLQFVPGLANVREPGRAIVVVYLGMSVLLGFAIAASRPRRAMILGGLAIILIDFWSAPIRTFTLTDPPIYRTLAAMPDAGALLELPLGIGDGFAEYGRLDNAVMLYQTAHRRPLLGGFVARLGPRLEAQHRESPVLATLLNLSGTPIANEVPPASLDATMRFLQSHQVRYVIVDVPAASPAMLEYVDRLPLTLVAEEEGRRLYRIP